MPDVLVEIAGKKYRMACEEGEEQHLLDLAAAFDHRVDTFKGQFGEIGDARLTVMAGIGVLDELGESRRRIAALESEVERLNIAGEHLAEDYQALEQKFARRLADAALRLESIAVGIDETST
ncbi:MAG: cell division protein ZapA [Devosia sp.]